MFKCFNIISKFLTLILFSAFCSANPIPVENFAYRDAINNVTLSPNGKKLALLRIPEKKGNPVLEIYDTDNFEKAPFRMNADPMELMTYYWISDTNIIFLARQKVRDDIEGFNRGVYETKLVKLDVAKKKIDEFRDITNPGIANLLPEEPEKVILSFQPEESGGPAAWQRPRSYYIFDLKSGKKTLLLRGSPERFSVEFDRVGNPVFGMGFDLKSDEFIYYVREPNKTDWIEVYRRSENSFEQFNIEGFDPADNNKLLVSAHNGNDTVGLWEFDYKAKKFGELIYLRQDADVMGTRKHSNRWQNTDEIASLVYATDKRHYLYLSGEDEAVYKQLGDLIPNNHYLIITSRSRDGQSLTVFNQGPKDAGTYYLLHKGKISKFGEKNPRIKPDNLSKVEYVTYTSRDGFERYAYVTIPEGKGPFPAVVMPHGGPFVGELVDFDEWGQMLANNGYVVIQPQYRGSKGHGLNYYKSAFLPKGEGGGKMQDDKDDAALHLVEKGLVDKDRIAMFGWSYGGYAALIAASRKNQIYQCAIAGAAVSDNKLQVDYYRYRLRGAAKIEQLGFWDQSISPIKEVSKVNIPLLMIHGSVDQRVPPDHAKLYMEEVKKLNIPVKYVELEGADHFSNTLYFDHKIKLYESILSFLKNDCGPEGL